MTSKNLKLLDDFSDYCVTHPKERFWQALRNWSMADRIYMEIFNPEVDDMVLEDTFYFNKKNK